MKRNKLRKYKIYFGYLLSFLNLYTFFRKNKLPFSAIGPYSCINPNFSIMTMRDDNIEQGDIRCWKKQICGLFGISKSYFAVYDSNPVTTPFHSPTLKLA